MMSRRGLNHPLSSRLAKGVTLRYGRRNEYLGLCLRAVVDHQSLKTFTATLTAY